MKPDNELLINDERIKDLKQLIQNYINKGDNYNLEKINEVIYFEKVNQIHESNIYICSVDLSLKKEKSNNNNKDIFNEEYLIEEDIPSGKKFLRYIIHRNPNI